MKATGTRDLSEDIAHYFTKTGPNSSYGTLAFFLPGLHKSRWIICPSTLTFSYDQYEQSFYCRLTLRNRGDIYGCYFPLVLSLCRANAKKRNMSVEARTETINSYTFWSLGLYKQHTGMQFNELSVNVRLYTICSAIIMFGLYRVPAAHDLTI